MINHAPTLVSGYSEMTKFGELKFGDLTFGEMTTVGEMTFGNLTFVEPTGHQL